MVLACSCDDYDGDGWYYYPPEDYTTLKAKRRRRCKSCGAMIDVGSTCIEFLRGRGPRSDIEENIHGDEVELAPYYMCEECSDLYFSLNELGFCVSIEPMRRLVKEYAAMQAYRAKKAAAQRGNNG